MLTISCCSFLLKCDVTVMARWLLMYSMLITSEADCSGQRMGQSRSTTYKILVVSDLLR